MTASGFLVTLVLVLLVFCTSRQVAAVAVIAAVCYLTEGQVVAVAGFHFTAIRLVLMAGIVRVVARGELRQLRLNAIDKFLVAYGIALLIVSTMRVGTAAELIYQIGCLYNVFLAYFVFRCFLREIGDIREVLVCVAFLIVPLAFLMLLESRTDRNVFSAFGGVGEFSMVRDGHVRCQGPFRSPITAGAFGVTFALLYVSMVFAKARIRVSLVGLVASLLIVAFAHSSGPLSGLALGILALACWSLRRHTRTICWGLVVSLFGLQFVMKAPAWFLIARVSDLIGGGGYHRAYLIDQFVNHLGSWWLAGTSDTHDWFPYELSDGTADLTNKFVTDGVVGGLIGLILSVAIVVRCFRQVGLAMKNSRAATEKLLWGIGSTLVGSIGILFSVAYFDQMQVVWYFLLACIAGVGISGRGQSPGYMPRIRAYLAPQICAEALTQKVDI